MREDRGALGMGPRLILLILVAALAAILRLSAGSRRPRPEGRFVTAAIFSALGLLLLRLGMRTPADGAPDLRSALAVAGSLGLTLSLWLVWEPIPRDAGGRIRRWILHAAVWGIPLLSAVGVDVGFFAVLVSLRTGWARKEKHLEHPGLCALAAGAIFAIGAYTPTHWEGAGIASQALGLAGTTRFG
ncbi:MAG: hypothetical protein DRH04_10685, partial [Deltaproteobacteria bacterium]